MIYIGMILIIVVGTLLHFVYEWTDHNKIAAIFAAVNESTWEHIKICMTPTLLWSIYEITRYGLNSQFIIGKSLCLLTIILLIPILFYAYTAFTKKSILWVDVICFCITVVCSQLVFNHMIMGEKTIINLYVSIVLLLIELGAYFSLTFHPPKNFIFKDPITKLYGLDGHPCHHHHDH